MNDDRESYMRAQDAHHDMLAMRNPDHNTTAKTRTVLNTEPIVKAISTLVSAHIVLANGGAKSNVDYAEDRLRELLSDALMPRR